MLSSPSSSPWLHLGSASRPCRESGTGQGFNKGMAWSGTALGIAGRVLSIGIAAWGESKMAGLQELSGNYERQVRRPGAVLGSRGAVSNVCSGLGNAVLGCYTTATGTRQLTWRW